MLSRPARGGGGGRKAKYLGSRLVEGPVILAKPLLMGATLNNLKLQSTLNCRLVVKVLLNNIIFEFLFVLFQCVLFTFG